MNADTKVCSGPCQAAKPVIDFPLFTGSLDGRSAVCDHCRTAPYEPNAPHFADAWRHIRWVGYIRQPAPGTAYQRRQRRLVAGTFYEFDTQDVFDTWAERDMWACVACGADWEHIDHVVPLALGGEHSLENLQPLCGPCNLGKSARNPWVWITEVAPSSRVGRNLLVALGDV